MESEELAIHIIAAGVAVRVHATGYQTEAECPILNALDPADLSSIYSIVRLASVWQICLIVVEHHFLTQLHIEALE